MSGHTPGPWGYEDPLGPDILSVVANPDAPPYEWLHVAQIGFTDDEDDGRSFAEHEANARLIAAAPELLEALLTVDRIVLEQRCERGTPWDRACTTIAEKVRQHVAPAIARATGAA